MSRILIPLIILGFYIYIYIQDEQESSFRNSCTTYYQYYIETSEYAKEFLSYGCKCMQTKLEDGGLSSDEIKAYEQLLVAGEYSKILKKNEAQKKTAEYIKENELFNKCFNNL